MELLLWRWSTIVQICSDIMIALFFLSLAYSTQRVELKPWVKAWLANLGALLVTVVYWMWQPDSWLIFKGVSALYIFFKSLFVVLLLVGLQQYVSRGYIRVNRHAVLMACALFGVVGGVAVPSLDWLGVLQSSAICVALGLGTVMAFRSGSTVLAWLGVGFAMRSVLALIEAMSYGINATVPGNELELVSFFLASHSSFDSAAEWCIALGCVLALYRTIQRELMATCDDLIEVKNELQDLVDKDPLTGLGNRRTLRHVLEKAQMTGAVIAFFDLDNFKVINDRYGHNVGDKCLKVFARALQENFRPEDHIVRYAGDEFVVIAEGVEESAVQERVELLRESVGNATGEVPQIMFSTGISLLEIGGEPEIALNQADEAMYGNKSHS